MIEKMSFAKGGVIVIVQSNKQILGKKGVKKETHLQLSTRNSFGETIMSELRGMDPEDSIEFVDTNEDSWNDQSTYGFSEEYFERRKD